MRNRSVRLLFLLLPLLASCSLALSKGPPTGWRDRGLSEASALESCDPTPTWGFVDIGISVASLAAGYIASAGRLGPDEDRGEHILVGGFIGGLFGVGGTIGFLRADACQDFRALLAGSPRAPGYTILEIDEVPARDPSLVTGDELVEELDRSLLSALQRLRPQWLRPTGARYEPPSVILNDQGAFDLDILQTIPPEDVEWVRLVTPSDATTRWGTGYVSGAIEVRTRR